MQTPILYSFRRCPYCIRAHMALKYAGQRIILRDVELKNLPPEVLSVSPNATVPVLVFNQSQSMVESWDIMKWAVQQHDPHNWCGEQQAYLHLAEALVQTNDFSFKIHLDHYKYADRFPEHSMQFYRRLCESFIAELNILLEKNTFLISQSISIADVALFPFIRQFAYVDKGWFDQSPYKKLQHWLDVMMDTTWFKQAFTKRPVWHAESEDLYI